MKGEDKIKDLFSDKLGGFEAKVNPELWGKVATQIGAGSAATATGMSLATKLFIGLGAASVVTVASVVLLNNDKAPVKEEVAQVEIIEDSKPEVQPEKTLVVTPEDIQNDIVNVPVNNFVNEPVYSEPTPEPIPEVFTPKPFIVEKDHIRFEDDPIKNAFTKKDQIDLDSVGEQIEDPLIDVVPEEDLITEESTEIDLVFPNIFTPNGDGANDYLFINNTESLQEEGFLVRIINSNYKEVYTSNKPDFKWDGRDLGGEELPNGYYIAFITCKDKDGFEAKPVMFQFEIRK